MSDLDAILERAKVAIRKGSAFVRVKEETVVDVDSEAIPGERSMQLTIEWRETQEER